ncbi:MULTISPECIES: flagellar basal body rod protein FlgC [Bosea]|jgi:flagellar basal-body rod protein FlgC|uniref:Flagellar basal-body rod protein FlgC n=1 Tax=Bosea vaviloviae TaxID=1526658 RepID=A0A1D7TVY7_9HYPH|nr:MULTISPECIES: flagellar basal body rod protein FlgC [Bosea]AOO79276.1 flagellar basal body rod protein FlgC [Bosea vaviloviae]MDR6869140.1 flagellar basal-body rod protein FlgC [Bosea sp. BE125]
MIDPIDASLRIAGAGLQAQSTRVRVVSENLANAQSTGKTAGADPYRRKTVTFENTMDRALGAALVKIKGVGVDKSAFRVEFEPSHPAADAKGYVKLPNVSMLLEMADMREANRSYEANLQMIKQVRSMQSMTIDLLRNG